MKKNRLFILIIVLAICASSIVGLSRISIEAGNKRVDFTLDYVEFEKMAKQSDYNLAWWFGKMKDQGVGSVALNEESLESLMKENKPLKIEMMGNILKDIDKESNYPKELTDYLKIHETDEFDLVAITKSKDLYGFIKKGLESRYEPKKFEILEGEDEYIFIFDGTEKDALYTEILKVKDSQGKTLSKGSSLYGSKLLSIGLGYDPEKIKLIKDSGLEIILRPYNYSSWSSDQLVEATLEDYKNFQIIPSYMIFGGSEVLGYPKSLELLKSYMEENDIKVGMIETGVQREHIEQKGLYELTRALNYDTVRTFSVWSWVQTRFKYYNYEGAEEIENTLYRAVTERNIRLIYFKPFKFDDFTYVTDLKEYEKMFDGFKDRIERHGITVGKASTMEPNRVRTRYVVLLGWGVVAGAMILLNSILPLEKNMSYALLGLGLLGVPAMVKVVPSLGDKILAMGAAIVFPSLSMVYFFSQCRRYFSRSEKKEPIHKWVSLAIKDLLIASAISFIGAVFVGTLLSNIEYLLEMDIYRGVKISQLLPILIYMTLYICYFGYREKDCMKQKATLRWKDMQKLLFDDVKIIYVVGGSILLLLGYVYIARTGHETNIQPSDFEMIGRNLLEQKLLARPRTKEFLMAFPALMVGVYGALKRYQWMVFISGLAAIIGQTSIVNTFSHLRTPMYLSFIRTLYSLGLGVVLGALGIFILDGVIRLIRNLRGEKLDA